MHMQMEAETKDCRWNKKKFKNSFLWFVFLWKVLYKKYKCFWKVYVFQPTLFSSLSGISIAAGHWAGTHWQTLLAKWRLHFNNRQGRWAERRKGKWRF